MKHTYDKREPMPQSFTSNEYKNSFITGAHHITGIILCTLQQRNCASQTRLFIQINNNVGTKYVRYISEVFLQLSQKFIIKKY